MAYEVALSVKIEALGAEFFFGPPDQALGELFRVAQHRNVDHLDPACPPPELIAPLAEIFVSGVKGWEGVVQADGLALPCSLENRQSVPTLDKVAVAAAYVEKALAVEEKKVEPDAPPTSSTPTESNMGKADG